MEKTQMAPNEHKADKSKTVAVDGDQAKKPPIDPSHPKIGEAKAPPLDPEVEKYLASDESGGKVR
jgi:hypothetical protein